MSDLRYGYPQHPRESAARYPQMHLARIPHTRSAAWAHNAESTSEKVIFPARRNSATPPHKNHFFTHIFNVLRPLATIEYGGCGLTVGVDSDGWVKLSFFGVPNLARLRPPLVAPDNQLRVASLLDIAGTKVAVVQKRAEAKDYIDIDALITSGIELPTMLAAGQKLYGNTFAPESALKALCYFEEESLASLPLDMKVRLVKAVQNVDLDSLPSIMPETRNKEE